jgi:acetyl esterase
VPLDPAVKGMLDLLASMGAPPLSQGTAQSGRDGFRILTVELRDPAWVVPVGSTEDITVDGAQGPLRARVYRPEGVDSPAPTVVFFHGGGFVIGDLETHDNQCRWICRETASVVLSIDYRLAPESPFPGPVEDCLAATRWAAEHVAELGGDAGRIAVGGDSAGANLAAVVSQVARDEGGPSIAAQLLVYPAVDFVEDEGERYPSRRDNAEGYFLTVDDMAWFGSNYAGGTEDKTLPRLSPLYGDLTGLPPAVVVTAEFDPLRDEGEAYAAALEKAGVRVLTHRFDGLVHGFFDLAGLSPAAAEAVRTTCADLKTLLGS